MLTLNLPPEVEQKLRAQADRRSLSLEAYLEFLVTRQDLYENAAQVPAPEELTVEEFDRILDEMSAGLPPLPTLPENFSREDIYYDHD
jgi:hypothetical protein